MTDAIKDIINFWYADKQAKRWFKSSPEFDKEIKQRYESLWQDAANNQLQAWQSSAEGCLALCIILDQFPLNMFRGQAKAFSTEHQSIQIAKTAIERSFDDELDLQKVSFLYMPLMHSESIEDQDLCVVCFEKKGLEDNLRFAKHHRGIIQEFGRFPHRNKILGRDSTNDEITYLNSKHAFKG